MANTDKKFDSFFREKLEKYEEKPSSLAWEKLESKLEQKPKGNAHFPWMQLAASLVFLLVASFAIWNFVPEKEGNHSGKLAQEIPENIEQVIEDRIEEEKSLEPKQAAIETDLTPTMPWKMADSTPMESPAPDRKARQEIPAKNHEALLSEQNILKEEQMPIAKDLPEIKLPELPIGQTLAQMEKEEEEVAYRITIKSSGLRSEPQKMNIFTEIENKKEKIGSFLNKVEQGLADLQDAKSNLFAINSSRKEQSN